MMYKWNGSSKSNRKAVRNVYKKGSSFKIGQGNILKEGKDILIIAAGQLVSEALDCAEELEKEGYSVEVIDMFTIKPLDEKLLIKEAKGKSKIVTIENHSIYGGLGSASKKNWCQRKIWTSRNSRIFTRGIWIDR